MSRTTWRTIAAASLALNLFVLGFAGAQAWRWRSSLGLLMIASSQPVDGGGMARVLIEHIAGRLPAQDAVTFRAAFAGRLPELVGLQHASSASLDRIRRDVAAEPFDAVRLRDDLQASRQARLALVERLQDTLLETLPRLSPQGRAALASIRLLPLR